MGDSEPELDVILDELINGRKIGVNVGASQVVYLETLGRGAVVDHTYKREISPGGEFARVVLSFEPSPPGSGFAYEFDADCQVDEDYWPAVRKGLERARLGGLLAGIPVTDFTARLVGGAQNDAESSQVAFEIAAFEAFRQLRDQAEPVLIEPVMALYVTAPFAALDAVLAHLTRKRGTIATTDKTEDAAELEAFVPLASLFGYGTTLQALTDGRASCTMRFSHYAPAPLWTDPDGVFPGSIGMRA